jgi:hypothetical protein
VAATPQSSKTDFNAERDKVVKEISLAAGFDGVLGTIADTPNLKGVPDHRNVSEGDFEKSLNNVWDVAWQEGARGACPVQMYVFPHWQTKAVLGRARLQRRASECCAVLIPVYTQFTLVILQNRELGCQDYQDCQRGQDSQEGQDDYQVHVPAAT